MERVLGLLLQCKLESVNDIFSSSLSGGEECKERGAVDFLRLIWISFGKFISFKLPYGSVIGRAN